MFWNKKRESAVSCTSVTQDWCARLPADKKTLFDTIIRGWEDAYAIFSVSLDDGMSLRAEGKLVRARQCAEIAAASAPKLTEALGAACRTLGCMGRHLVSPPAVNPLNPHFFRSEAASQNAHWNQLMHYILFGGRSRFLHKLRVLEITVADLAADFCRACNDLSEDVRPDASWLRLDELHYDLNTCLREIVVVLKSFLLALPGSLLTTFHNELTAATLAARETPRPSLVPAILGRRAGYFRRE